MVNSDRLENVTVQVFEQYSDLHPVLSAVCREIFSLFFFSWCLKCEVCVKGLEKLEQLEVILFSSSAFGRRVLFRQWLIRACRNAVVVDAVGDSPLFRLYHIFLIATFL